MIHDDQTPPRRAPFLAWLATALMCMAFNAHADVPAAAASNPGTVATPAAAASTGTAAVHPDVQRALDYKLPESTCTPPTVRRKNQNPGQAEAVERKQKFYFKCVEEYQKGLFADFQFLKDSVTHGVTMPQAAVIKDHLETVAARIKQLQNTGSQAQQAWLQASGERSQGGGKTKGAGDMSLHGGGISTGP